MDHALGNREYPSVEGICLLFPYAHVVRAVDAASCVAGLQETLNRNLAALAGARHFEETVMSLAAAIHLLNSRLGELPARTPVVSLEPARHKGQAA